MNEDISLADDIQHFKEFLVVTEPEVSPTSP
jgi:hypothetical protein